MSTNNVNTDLISDDEETAFAYFHLFSNWCKDSCGKSIQELMERELTEIIGRCHVSIFKDQAAIREAKARTLKAEREAEVYKRRLEVLERQHAAANIE